MAGQGMRGYFRMAQLVRGLVGLLLGCRAERVDEDPPPRLAACRDGQVAGYIRPHHHDDLSRLLAIGVPLSITLTEELMMRILVNYPTERAVWFGDAGP